MNEEIKCALILSLGTILLISYIVYMVFIQELTEFQFKTLRTELAKANLTDLEKFHILNILNEKTKMTEYRAMKIL